MGRLFLLPVRIALLLVAAGVGAIATYWLMWESRIRDDAAELARMSMRDRAIAVETAHEYLLRERIPFSLYKDVLHAALQADDPAANNAANSSIARLLESQTISAKDMKRDLGTIPPQVFIVTFGEKAGQLGKRVGDALASRQNLLVRRAAGYGQPKGNAIVCFDQPVCDSLGRTVAALLNDENIAVAEPKKQDRASTPYPRIDILLASELEATPVKAAEQPKPDNSPQSAEEERPKARRRR